MGPFKTIGSAALFAAWETWPWRTELMAAADDETAVQRRLPGKSGASYASQSSSSESRRLPPARQRKSEKSS
jgi:hypothetical protein